MRTIRIENIEDGKPKQEIIFDMQPDHMEENCREVYPGN